LFALTRSFGRRSKQGENELLTGLARGFSKRFVFSIGRDELKPQTFRGLGGANQKNQWDVRREAGWAWQGLRIVREKRREKRKKDIDESNASIVT